MNPGFKHCQCVFLLLSRHIWFDQVCDLTNAGESSFSDMHFASCGNIFVSTTANISFTVSFLRFHVQTFSPPDSGARFHFQHNANSVECVGPDITCDVCGTLLGLVPHTRIPKSSGHIDFRITI